MKFGDVVPNFILKDETGNDFELYKNIDQFILLAFYPKDDTPVCSSQLADYNKNINEFVKNKINVVGINSDSVESHLEFSKKLGLKFPLLSDSYKKVGRQFDALNLLGINKRLLVLINSDKRVIWTASTLSINFIKSEEIIEKTLSTDSKK
jgi:peroxiredoxin